MLDVLHGFREQPGIARRLRPDHTPQLRKLLRKNQSEATTRRFRYSPWTTNFYYSWFMVIRTRRLRNCAIGRLLGSAPAHDSDGRQPRPRPSRHARTTLHIRTALPAPGAAQTMITKEKHPIRVLFFRDHEITAKSRHNR